MPRDSAGIQLGGVLVFVDTLTFDVEVDLRGLVEATDGRWRSKERSERGDAAGECSCQATVKNSSSVMFS